MAVTAATDKQYFKEIVFSEGGNYLVISESGEDYNASGTYRCTGSTYEMSKFGTIQIIRSSKGSDIENVIYTDLSGTKHTVVCIVETGTTLKENNLAVLETIVPISARLIANKASFVFYKARIEELTRALAQEVEK